MAAAFLDPIRPIATCNSAECAGCPLSKEVHCHFRAADLAAFLLMVVPLFFVGGTGIWQVSPWWLIPWGLAMVAYFGLVEIRVMCSHCPHYAEPGKSLQCWANYGSPRLWKYRPGPMTTGEKIVFLSGLSLIIAYPLVFLVLGAQWLFLAIYVMAGSGGFATLRRSYCSQCMNFACPLNTVGEAVRTEFFRRNPAVARAWGRLDEEASAS